MACNMDCDLCYFDLNQLCLRWYRIWTVFWTMSLDFDLVSKAIICIIACHKRFLTYSKSLHLMGFIVILALCTYFCHNLFQHTVFSSCMPMYISIYTSCKYKSLIHVQNCDSIYLCSGHIMLQLLVLPRCKAVECICRLVWVYLYLLIIHLTGSVILDLPALAPQLNIPGNIRIVLFYTRLTFIRYFRKRCSIALRVDLSAVRPLIDFDCRLSDILTRFCSAFVKYCIYLLILTSSIFAQIFNNLHVWFLFCNLPVRSFS